MGYVKRLVRRVVPTYGRGLNGISVCFCRESAGPVSEQIGEPNLDKHVAQTLVPSRVRPTGGL